MKSAFGLLSILLTAVIGIGIYLFYAKQSEPAPHMVVTQNISVTGVKSDLMAIAQAERMYFVQNGSYTDLPTLASSGTMNITRTNRDGYAYAVDPSASGFMVTASYTAPPPEMPAGVPPPHFPTFTIDQTMEIHQGE